MACHTSCRQPYGTKILCLSEFPTGVGILRSKAIPVTGRGGLYGDDEIPHCLDNRLTDGGKVVSPTYRPHFTLQKHYFSASDTKLCYRLNKPQDLVRPEGLGKLKNIHSPYRVSKPRPSGL
jgi:hypothetical protein